MEGISHEACSLAGTLRLSKLVAFYDDNGISIDGHVEGWFTDDTPRRFEAYGWNVIAGVDGHDPEQVDAAIRRAKASAVQPDGRPTLICCKTVIGKGSPNKAGTHDVHGARAGRRRRWPPTREALGWTAEPFARAAAAGRRVGRARPRRRSRARLARAFRGLPGAASPARRRVRAAHGRRTAARLHAAKLPAVLEAAAARSEPTATRKSSQQALDAIAPLVPELFGGSADLTASNLTNFKGCVRAGRDTPGNHLSYGVREFAMAAIMNGIALHRGHIPYGGTFLTFSDYSRNAIRMAALMKLRVIHVFTHDSIGLGEDGPTHQSVEHVPSLRLIPQPGRLAPVRRTRDGRGVGERARARRRAIGTVPVAAEPARGSSTHRARRTSARGGYVLSDMDGARVAIIATGSEVALACAAQAELALEGIATRVVSMPCTNRFDRQPQAYQDEVLPPDMPAMAVEAAHPDFWRKYVGRSGRVIGIATFGESAPAKDLYAHFGITVQRVAEEARQLAHRGRQRGAQDAGRAGDGSMSAPHAQAFDLVMFDLDGTLVETAPEIQDAVNDTLRAPRAGTRGPGGRRALDRPRHEGASRAGARATLRGAAGRSPPQRIAGRGVSRVQGRLRAPLRQPQPALSAACPMRWPHWASAA